mmetsp:Transcript_17248/g.31096  ORF Transcript_17248/g.31096 Transcript_17248/m.31096 type:complete len:375 (+) Transcript_17248:92-1216(+)
MASVGERGDLSLPISRSKPPVLSTPTSSFTVPQTAVSTNARGPTTSGGRRAWADMTPGPLADATPTPWGEGPYPTSLFPPTPTPTGTNFLYGGLHNSLAMGNLQPQSWQTSVAPAPVQSAVPQAQMQVVTMPAPVNGVPMQDTVSYVSSQPQQQMQAPQAGAYMLPAPVAAPTMQTAPGSESGMPQYGAVLIGVPVMPGGVASGYTTGVPQQQALPVPIPAAGQQQPQQMQPQLQQQPMQQQQTTPAEPAPQAAVANAGRQVLMEAYGVLGTEGDGQGSGPSPSAVAAVAAGTVPSLGSAEHATGQCRPCAWYWKAQGCQNGANCTYCHLCPEDELKRRKKVKVAAMRMGALEPSKPGEGPVGAPRTLKLGPLL